MVASENENGKHSVLLMAGDKENKVSDSAEVAENAIKVPLLIGQDLESVSFKTRVESGTEDVLVTNKLAYPDIVLDVKTTPEPEISILPVKRQRGWRKYSGILLAVVAAVQFSFSALVIKVLNYHPYNLGVWRFLIMVFIPIPFIAHGIFWKKQAVFKTVWPPNLTLLLLLFQGAVASNSILLVFYGIKNLNVADCLVISNSAPVFVTFLAYFFLGEKCSIFSVCAALVALCGVFVIARPPFLTGAEEFDTQALVGAAMAFGSMLLLTATYIVVRYLRNVHHGVVQLAFSLWGFLQSLVVGLVLEVVEKPANLKEIVLILTSAVLAFSAQTCMTLALKYEQAGTVSLIRTSEVIFAFLLQIIFLSVNPDIFSLVGATIVICCVILTTLRKMLLTLPTDNKYRRMFCI